ncbi:MAG: hypothetical protein U0637_13095 [Phycisphaerales bacterium]
MAAGAAQAQGAGKADPALPDTGGSPDQVVQNGYRRFFRTDIQQSSPAEIANLLADGKAFEQDPATGGIIRRTFTDHLPAGWRMQPWDDGVQRDSMGNLIVNQAMGLPGWAQWNVNALRSAITDAQQRAVQARAAGVDAREVENELGNYVGQALTRSIPIDDIFNIDSSTLVTPGVGQAMVRYLEVYENLRFNNQDLFHYTYQPSTYPPRVQNFVARQGGSMNSIYQLEVAMQDRGAGGCFSETTLPTGFTFLAGDTNIWAGTGTDDDSADISTGFPLFFFYNCNDRDNNDQVRVSTNGYLTFFQQGGDALDGTEYVNMPIPDATAFEPSGFAAPAWDDYWVAPAQGTQDRVSYLTEGVSPNRVFSVQYSSISHLGGTTTDFHWFMIKLYETSGVVELLLDSGGNWSADTNDSATIGLENYAGDAGDCGPNCTATNAGAPTESYRYTPERPFNDDCSFPQQLLDGTSLNNVDINSAAADASSTCGTNGTRDLFYSYTATCNGNLRVTTCGSRNNGGAGAGPDTVMSFHSACPATNANTISCTDDTGTPGCGDTDSTLSQAMAAGQTVYIRVATYSNTAFRHGNGLIDISADFTPSSPPANDNCTGAEWLGCGQSVTGNTSCADDDIALSAIACGTSISTPGVWYRVVGTGQTMTATTCNGAFTYDTKITVFAGPCGGLTCVSGNDDSCTTSGLFSTTSWGSVAGEVYHILVHGFAGATGAFTLSVSSAAPMVNNACANAIPVGAGGLYAGTLSCATTDGAASCGSSNSSSDVWYRFVAPTNGALSASLCGSRASGGIDGVLTVFGGSCAGPEVLCNDDAGGAGCDSLDSFVTGTMTAGQVAVIRVSYFGGSTFRLGNGNFFLSIGFAGCDSIDWNGDGLFPDTQDITDFITVFGGGFCAAPNPPVCNTDIDFNNDGLFPDTDDITAFINAFAGGPCP